MLSVYFDLLLGIAAILVAFLAILGDWYLMRSLRQSSTANLPSMGLEVTGFAPPRELTATDLPRPVRFTGIGKAGLGLGGFGLLACLGLTWWSVSRKLERVRAAETVAETGVPIAGEVTGKYHGDGKGRTYNVYFRYPADGKSRFGSARVTAEFFATVENGSPIGVRYLSSEPETNRADAELPPESPWGGALSFFPFLTLIAVPWQHLRQRQLLRHGKVTWGVVTGIERQRHSLLVGYHFRNETEEMVHGGSKVKVGESLKIGDVIVVLHDRNRQNLSSAYPLTAVRVMGAQR